MGNVLDTILLQELIETPETINTNYISEVVDITFRENEFSIGLTYDNGSSVNMNLYLAVSVDGVNFSRIPLSEQEITDDNGSHIWSIAGEGASFLRVEIDVAGGSIDLQTLSYRGRRRH